MLCMNVVSFEWYHPGYIPPPLPSSVPFLSSSHDVALWPHHPAPPPHCTGECPVTWQSHVYQLISKLLCVLNTPRLINTGWQWKWPQFELSYPPLPPSPPPIRTLSSFLPIVTCACSWRGLVLPEMLLMMWWYITSSSGRCGSLIVWK